MSPTRRHRRHARQPSPQRQERRSQRGPSALRGVTTAHPLARDIMRAAHAAAEGLTAGKVPLGDQPEVAALLELHADVVRR